MKKKTVEITLYAAIFCLAVILRFILLGASPLPEGEAAAALDAFHLSKGLNVVFDGQAGYVLLTSVLFYFLKSGEFWARFLPALIGSSIVLAPLLYRKHLGSLPSLLLAAGLAVDPSLIISSRIANGSVFGITFFLFALGFLISGHPVLAGIIGALTLLGGPSAWFGLCAVLLTAVVYSIFRKYRKNRDQQKNLPDIGNDFIFNWKHFLVSFGITVLLIFSIFLIVPDGLGGIFAGLAAFFQGWSQPSDMAAGTAIWSLLFYEALPILIGIVAMLIALQRKESLVALLSAGTLVSLILLLLYPARSFSLFPWVVMPLWVLLAKYLLAEYSLDDVEPVPFFALLAVILIVIVFGVLNLKGIFTGGAADTASMQLRAASLLGSLLIIIVATGLVIWGWSISSAIKAFFGAMLTVLLVFNISTIWNVIKSPLDHKQEIWLTNAFVDEDLFMQTESDYRRWNIGDGKQSSVLISGVDSKALDWSLRLTDKVEHVQALPDTFNPEMVITDSSGQLLLENEYAGQDFILSRQPVWADLNAWGWFRWFFLRNTPCIDKSIILWVRVDQFPGYEANELLPTN